MNMLMSRHSNTAETLTKQFRENISILITNHNGTSIDQPWSWERIKNEFFHTRTNKTAINYFTNNNNVCNQLDEKNILDNRSSHSLKVNSNNNNNNNNNNNPAGNDNKIINVNVNEEDANIFDTIFTKYLFRLQHIFFVHLLLLLILFTLINIIVAIVDKIDTKYPAILFVYICSLIVFTIFTVIVINDEYIFRPKQNRLMVTITIFVTIIFNEYGSELFKFKKHLFTLQRIRPIICIIIATIIFLPFHKRKSSILSSIIIILIELIMVFYLRINVCHQNNIALRLIISDNVGYIYSILFGFFIKTMLEINAWKAFCNYYKYIESRININEERKHQEELLNSCFPRHLIDDIRKDIKDLFKREIELNRPFRKLYVSIYNDVTILYADIVNSMLLTSSLTSNELVETLNNLFGRFDKCAEKNNCLRIKLLGDCYYCVSGLPIYDENHAWNCVQMGLGMIKIINSIRKSKNIDINMRIGIHSGRVLSGVMGNNKWQFDIWSEDTIRASMMEHEGKAGYLNITQETYDRLPKKLLNKRCHVKKYQNNEQQSCYLLKRKKRAISLTDLSSTERIIQESNPVESIENNLKQEDPSITINDYSEKLRRRSSFSATGLSTVEKSLKHQNSVLETGSNTEFIDQEIERMPLSFKKNFKNFHGIHPITLMFVKRNNQQQKHQHREQQQEQELQRIETKIMMDEQMNSINNFDEISENNWKLEKEFQTTPDDYFLISLILSLILAIIIGLIQYCIIPKLHSNIRTWILQLLTISFIALSSIYSFKFPQMITLWKRILIWLIVNVLLMGITLNNLILTNCNKLNQEYLIELAINEYDSANCPYVWSYTMCTILSITGISVFITINIWLKFLLRIIGLIGFTLILFNQCSVYQSIIPCIDDKKQWICNVGFDPILSHFYYILMAIIILTVIDRQIEYVLRLNFKLWKRLQKEKHDTIIMAEINQILLKTILPTFLIRKYINNRTFANQLYSESYQYCVVMFASIPNYSEFYSENQLNGKGFNCLVLLNEIICDFDLLLDNDRFQRIEKIKTNGSTYMAAAGLQPGRELNDDNEFNTDSVERINHIMTMMHFVMALMETLKNINRHALQEFKLRVGIAVGPVIAGIVGASKPQYDIWGDTVNVASRMDSTGVIGRIQVTNETAELIISSGINYEEHFTLEHRGQIPVKGKGILNTYLVKTKFDFENVITECL